MRTIKFRVWNQKYKTWCGKEKGDWWVGMEYNTGKLVCIVDGKISNAPEYLMPQMFTGLHDKNGKEIYEGDIVKSKHYLPDEQGRYVFPSNENNIEFRNEAVTWNDKKARFDNCYGEVIGNIYENSELLK